MDYSEMARRFDEGTILLGVDRPGARKFFTDLGLRRIRDLIGEVPYFEWLLVRSSFMGAPICLLGSLAFAALAFHWWTILVAPFTLLVFIYWWVTSPRADRRSGWSALLLAGAIASLFTSAGLPLKLWLIFTAASLFLIRFTYAAATFLLRCLVVRNSRAYQLCLSHDVVVVRDAE